MKKERKKKKLQINTKVFTMGPSSPSRTITKNHRQPRKGDIFLNKDILNDWLADVSNRVRGGEWE